MNCVFEAVFQRYLEMVEGFLGKLPWDQSTLSQGMCYSLLGGGKRIRPVLALAVAETLGENPEKILPAAVSLEFIHTYSLIHDDLPAMDDDDYRRGKPANHKVFGVANAILAGDALLTNAFELLADPGIGLPDRQLRVIREVAAAAGKDGMVGGQVADLAGEGKALSLEEVKTINIGKTGALLTAAVRLGGVLAGAGEQQLEALTKYAQSLGLAFQIKDDILDVTGDSETLGKPAGSDVRAGKTNYVTLLGIKGAERELRAQILQAQAALEQFGDRAAFLCELADYVEQRQH